MKKHFLPPTKAIQKINPYKLSDRVSDQEGTYGIVVKNGELQIPEVLPNETVTVEGIVQTLLKRDMKLAEHPNLIVAYAQSFALRLRLRKRTKEADSIANSLSSISLIIRSATGLLKEQEGMAIHVERAQRGIAKKTVDVEIAELDARLAEAKKKKKMYSED